MDHDEIDDPLRASFLDDQHEQHQPRHDDHASQSALFEAAPSELFPANSPPATDNNLSVNDDESSAAFSTTLSSMAQSLVLPNDPLPANAAKKNCCSMSVAFAAQSPFEFNPPLSSDPLSAQPKPPITISETMKASDHGSSSTYTTYLISFSLPAHNIVNLQSSHRYSDFESLARILRKMHPTLIVPPIPEKHGVKDLTPFGMPKEDAKMIDSRKRLLQLFLNKVASHPILSQEHIFHGFLNPNGRSWKEVLDASGVGHFLKVKDVKKATTGLKLTDSLLKNPDSHFLAAEEYTFKFSQQLSLISKHHSRILKHFRETTTIGSDLGAAYNAWSLTEPAISSAILAPQIEAVGQAMDCTVTSTHKLLHALEEYVAEPLAVYEKLTATVDTTLRWRHALHVEYEVASEGLVQNRILLGRFETAESDAQRVAASLRAEVGGRSGAGGYGAAFSTPAPPAINASGSNRSDSLEIDDPNDPYAETRRALATYNTSTGLSRSMLAGVTPSTAENQEKPSTSNILANFTNLLISDKNPDATRRVNIVKTKEKIASLESERVANLSKLGVANEAIQKDLDRFQKEKVHDFRNMFLIFAVAQRDHARRCLAAWKEASEVIEGGEGNLDRGVIAGSDVSAEGVW